MGEFPNKETQFKSGAQQVAIATKAGRVKSAKKQLAARIRELKKKGLTDENAKLLVQMMEFPEISALEILEHIRKMGDRRDMTVKERGILVKSLTEWHKVHHGIKKDSPDVMINIQNNFMTPEMVDKIIERFLGDKNEGKD